MPDPSDHLDPKEATEARLCAYLEGTLLPAERAEIERHLAANPQHRRLLAELATTREWTRLLPFENVPIDLAEAFQGQVERSLLLGDEESRDAAVSRWPQLMLIAATILLTAGLAAVIWAMLPGRGPNWMAYKYGPVTQPAESEPAPPGPASAPALASPPVVAPGTSAGGVNGLAQSLHGRTPRTVVVLTVATDRPAEALRESELFIQRHDVMTEPGEPPAANANATIRQQQFQTPAPMARGGNSAANNAGPYGQQVANASPPAVEPERELVAPQISRSLVADLKSALERQDVRRVVSESVEPPSGLVKGQSVTVTVPQLVGPGIDKTNFVRVADDGTVTLPMIDPVPAEGLTPAALSASVAEKYRQADLIKQPTVSVVPATQPQTPELKDDGPVLLIVRVKPPGQ